MASKYATLAIAFYIAFQWMPFHAPPGDSSLLQDVETQEAVEDEDGEDVIRYTKVKMDMSPFFSAMSTNRRRGKGKKNKDASTSTVVGNSNFYGGTDALHVKSFDGGKVAQLPVMNQHMCGSCWAIATATALKANFNLKEFNLRPDELPNLNYFISCSDRSHQTVVTSNDRPKWIIDLGSNQRNVHAGCNGGITGMALAMTQILGKFHRTDTSLYQSGTLGDLGKGPAKRQPLYNLPELSCSEYQSSAEELGGSFDTSKVDTYHLIRRKQTRGVYFPSMRDVRELIYHNKAVIVYVDIDSGLQSNKLFNTEVATLPKCQWKPSDYVQDEEGMRGNSIFKEADHAVVLVGWSCSKKAWLVQNSWGDKWGKGGKLYLYDENVCATDFSLSAHSGGAGPACMFGSSLSVFHR